MRLLALATLASVLASALGQSSSVDSYAASESPIARAGLLANIGSSGAKSAGAKVREHPRISHHLPREPENLKTLTTFGSFRQAL